MYLKHRKEMVDSGLSFGTVQSLHPRTYLSHHCLLNCTILIAIYIDLFLCFSFKDNFSKMSNLFIFFSVLQSTLMVWNPKTRSTTRCTRTFRTACSIVYRWEDWGSVPLFYLWYLFWENLWGPVYWHWLWNTSLMIRLSGCWLRH